MILGVEVKSCIVKFVVGVDLGVGRYGRWSREAVDDGRERDEEGKAAFFIDFSLPVCGIRVESEAVRNENQ
jgi:hypothetical protein